MQKIKNVFVVHTKKAKKNVQHCFKLINAETKIQKTTCSIEPLKSLSQITNAVPNSPPSTSISSSSNCESRKISFYTYVVDPKCNENINNIKSINQNKNKFLQKKTNIHFSVSKKPKQSKKSINFLISKNSSKNLESLIENEKSENKDCKSIIKILKIGKNKINEGRWSREEHKKFIEAIAEHGRNWKEVEEYVETRTSSQARSHSQKFVLKLKSLNSSEIDFDFSSEKIKNINDIIEVIKQKDEYKIHKKQYIINTLINLSYKITTDKENRINIEKQGDENYDNFNHNIICSNSFSDIEKESGIKDIIKDIIEEKVFQTNHGKIDFPEYNGFRYKESEQCENKIERNIISVSEPRKQGYDSVDFDFEEEPKYINLNESWKEKEYQFYKNSENKFSPRKFFI